MTALSCSPQSEKCLNFYTILIDIFHSQTLCAQYGNNFDNRATGTPHAIDYQDTYTCHLLRKVAKVFGGFWTWVA